MDSPPGAPNAGFPQGWHSLSFRDHDGKLLESRQDEFAGQCLGPDELPRTDTAACVLGSLLGGELERVSFRLSVGYARRVQHPGGTVSSRPSVHSEHR